MRLSFRNVAALLSVAAAASLSWYFSRPPAEPPAARNGGGLVLGYYLRDATLLGTDESGRTLFRIHAAEAVQDRDEDGLTLTDVRVEYRDEQAVEWSISAASAVTPSDRSYVDLEQVRLESDASEQSPRTVIETAHLRLDPNAYYASTDAAVSYRVGNTSVRGVGLEARLREDEIELKSQVHGTYTK